MVLRELGISGSVDHDGAMLYGTMEMPPLQLCGLYLDESSAAWPAGLCSREHAVWFVVLAPGRVADHRQLDTYIKNLHRTQRTPPGRFRRYTNSSTKCTGCPLGGLL
jgi:hypothetical protein